MSRRPRDEPSSSYSPVQKRPLSLGGGGYGGQQAYSEEQMSAKHVADHYSARSNQSLEERENSPIIHLKKLNNWIKSVLVQLYTRPGDRVLDLACGKGGDLIKWDKAKVGYYVGVDIAEGSIKDCMTRYTVMLINNDGRSSVFLHGLFVLIVMRLVWMSIYPRMLHLTYAAASLQCITHGRLKHVQDRPLLIYLHCFVLEALSLGRCLMLM